MTDAQLDRCRKRLERFLVDLLEPVGRSERRHWGSVYVRGLLLDGERKSVEPMAPVRGTEPVGMAARVATISPADG